ncbi:hypothetical protein HBI09_201410 [Parastagonospora nodorum]|nr:hypothetical protein HBI09_201410 [Parastagonospora nodorum]KAH4981612.1 hypothetical protein HBI77_221190 [Parastagonospora nodorum]KAH5987930.1 hypothetical protein HBI84_201680 [Parastagonospora nodorum]
MVTPAHGPGPEYGNHSKAATTVVLCGQEMSASKYGGILVYLWKYTMHDPASVGRSFERIEALEPKQPAHVVSLNNVSAAQRGHGTSNRHRVQPPFPCTPTSARLTYCQSKPMALPKIMRNEKPETQRLSL